MTRKLPEHIQDIAFAKEHELLDHDSWGRAAMRNLRRGIAGQLEHGILKHRCEEHQIEQALAGPFSTPRTTSGEVTLGKTMDSQECCCPVEHLNSHALTQGASGSGKTTKSIYLILQLIFLITGVWLFDLRKREFARLGPILAEAGVELVVIPARQLRFNLLQPPPFCDPRDYAARVPDNLVNTLGLPRVSTQTLYTAIHRQYQARGIFDGGQSYPVLNEVCREIEADKATHPETRRAILARLIPLLGSLPELCRYRRGWTTADLCKRKLAFDFSGVSEMASDLLLSSLLLSEFSSRLAQGVSNPKMDLWICCDEAAGLCRGENTSIADWIGLIRGTGIGLDLSVQSADLARPILSNTSNKFIAQSTNATDYACMGAAMGATKEQLRWATNHLVPGLFVGCMGQSAGLRRPFLFRVPEDPFEILRERMQTVAPTTVRPSDGGLGPLEDLETEEVTMSTGVLPSTTPTILSLTNERAPDRSGTLLNPNEARFLQAIVDEPDRPSSHYPQKAGISNRKAQQIRKRLVEARMLREERVNTNARGRGSIFLIPTELGLEALEDRKQGTRPTEPEDR